MKEIELKILEIKHNTIKEKITKLGGKKIFEGMMHALFFDTKEGLLKKRGEMLRLRKEGSKVILAHKKKIKAEGIKIREETEKELSSFSAARALLKKLGFKETLNMKKKRITYKLGNAKIECDQYLDNYCFVPEFIEIEAQTEEDLYECIKQLGFTKDDCKAWTGNDLIKYYGK